MSDNNLVLKGQAVGEVPPADIMLRYGVIPRGSLVLAKLTGGTPDSRKVMAHTLGQVMGNAGISVIFMEKNPGDLQAAEVDFELAVKIKGAGDGEPQGEALEQKRASDAARESPGAGGKVLRRLDPRLPGGGRGPQTPPGPDGP